MATDSVVLLLSDLHFGKDLLDVSANPLLELPASLRNMNLDQKIAKFFVRRCVGHSPQCVRGLSTYLPYLLSQYHADGYKRNGFDQVWLLGDQATIPHPSSYKFLRSYATEPEYFSNDRRISCGGLWVDADSMLAVPGNHDKLLQADLRLYREDFAEPLRLPTIEETGFAIDVKWLNARALVAIMVDGNIYPLHDNILGTDYSRHLASGRIRDGMAPDIIGALQTVRKNLGADYEYSLKVLLIHYAVDVQAVSGWGGLLSNILLPHACEGIRDLVQSLRDHIDLVVHGHLHKPALYRLDGVPVISVPSATQEGSLNGFYVIRVVNGKEVNAEYHSWNGRSFVRDPDENLSKELLFLKEVTSRENAHYR